MIESVLWNLFRSVNHKLLPGLSLLQKKHCSGVVIRVGKAIPKPRLGETSDQTILMVQCSDFMIVQPKVYVAYPSNRIADAGEILLCPGPCSS